MSSVIDLLLSQPNGLRQRDRERLRRLSLVGSAVILEVLIVRGKRQRERSVRPYGFQTEVRHGEDRFRNRRQLANARFRTVPGKRGRRKNRSQYDRTGSAGQCQQGGFPFQRFQDPGLRQRFERLDEQIRLRRVRRSAVLRRVNRSRYGKIATIRY